VLLLAITLLLFNCFNLFVICHADKMNNLINSTPISFICSEYSRADRTIKRVRYGNALRCKNINIPEEEMRDFLPRHRTIAGSDPWYFLSSRIKSRGNYDSTRLSTTEDRLKKNDKNCRVKMENKRNWPKKVNPAVVINHIITIIKPRCLSCCDNRLINYKSNKNYHWNSDKN